MKILIISPYFIDERIHKEDIRPVPIGVYSLAAAVKAHHHDVEVWNCQGMSKDPGRIRSGLNEKRPDLVGFSILHGNRWGAVEIARIVREVLPDVKIIFGGIGATFLWEHLIRHFPEIDYIVLGEGEAPFTALIRWFVEGHDGTPDLIRGIAFKKDGKAKRTKPEEPIQDLDEWPIPARYFDYQHIATSRGCAWTCTFCGSHRFWGGGVRFRSAHHVIKELQMLHKRGISHFFIADDTFTLNRARVIEICQGIVSKKLNISWNAISRVDCVDEEILLWMRKAGCIQISYGVESGSDKIRSLFNKKIKEKDIKRAFVMTKSVGILPRAYFIYGSPGEDWDTIQETIDLMHEIKPLSVVFYLLDLFPGTTLYEQYKKKSGLSDDFWLNKQEGIMYFETDPALSKEMVLEFGKRLRESFYSHIHRFVEDIQLLEREDLRVGHADFFSRLGMTFSHGEYSRIDVIKSKEQVAESCFRKSLKYALNPRAYLGLGMLQQKARKYEASVSILIEGLGHFPENDELNLCLGVSHLNLKNYRSARDRFLKCPCSPGVLNYIAECDRNLE